MKDDLDRYLEECNRDWYFRLWWALLAPSRWFWAIWAWFKFGRQ